MSRTLIPDAVITFSAEHCGKYTGMAYDGHFFYLVLPQERKIYRLNQDFILFQTIEAARPYLGICFDHSENCFWAWEDGAKDVIYKLNCRLEETGFITMCQNDMDPAPITGLSFYCGHHTILAAFSGSIREYSKEGLLTGVLQQTGSGGYSSVLSLYPYYAVVQTCENTQFIRIFSAQGQMAECYCFAGSYAIETILVTPYTEAADTTVILTLLCTDPCGCSCILRCKTELCEMGGCKCFCSWWNGDGGCGCDGNDCGCGCDNCECGCDNCGCKCCNSRCDSINDLLESIALMEAALSHILNAEGEKLQKAVELADSICELIEIDKSVNQTITRITLLEQTLYAKLEAVCCIDTMDTKEGCCSQDPEEASRF